MAERRRGPFSMVYGRWLDEWARAGLGRTQLLVMLKLCERLEFGKHGHVYAWYPRDELAEELGLTETAIKRAVRRLIDMKMLKVQHPGHKSKATVYMVMPSIPWRDKKRGTADGTPNDSKGYRDDAQRGTADGTPLRHKDGGEAADAAPRPEESPHRSFYAALMAERERRERDGEVTEDDWADNG